MQSIATVLFYSQMEWRLPGTWIFINQFPTNLDVGIQSDFSILDLVRIFTALFVDQEVTHIQPSIVSEHLQFMVGFVVLFAGNHQIRVPTTI